MLRNTRYGNELAMPATNAYQRSIVWVVGILCECQVPERLGYYCWLTVDV